VTIEQCANRAWSGVSPDWSARLSADAPIAETAEVSGTADDAGDRDLVSACLAGRRDAFDAIVRRHQRQVYQVCFRFVGTHEDASDLAQDVFVRAYRGLRGFKGQSALATWLYRIAVNVCLNRVSVKTPRFEPLDRAERADAGTEAADDAVLRDERAGQVRAAIARLPKKQRATLILRVYHDLPHDQIAAILGSSVGAVKANFFHALANLKKLLEHRS
jgi:RNA polymerase sigma-70 factor (ECF subfamily)